MRVITQFITARARGPPCTGWYCNLSMKLTVCVPSFGGAFSVVGVDTPPKINMEPNQGRWMEDDFPFQLDDQGCSLDL